jgi:hypothetical protein
MGTRINILLDHDLPDFREPATTLARLAPSTEATLAVREYWRRAGSSNAPDNLVSWRAEPNMPRRPLLRHYTGPGFLNLSVSVSAARVRTGGRWRGFLSIEALRRVHLLAFRAIARALGSSCISLYGDSCEVDDLFWEGRMQRECVDAMNRMWGPPQPSVDAIDPRVAAATDHTVPLVWFLESSVGA